ncbi:MAG: hypothetical protein ACK6D3_22890 [Planctomycetaceae bacterium]
MSRAEAECPRCRAQLDLETLAQSQATTCPFCEGDVSALLAGWQPDIPERYEPRVIPSAEDAGHLLRPLPTGSRLQVVQSGQDQLVIFIASGGSGGTSLWWFSLFFTTILVFITAVFLFALAAPGQRVQGNPFVAYLVLGLFWLIALGLGWMAVRLKFSQTLLAVDPQRVVLKTILFGRTRQQELSLETGAECGLREAYSVNDVPVYAIEVGNGEDSVRFGTNLEPEDKEWLLDEIQHRLGSSGRASGPGTVRAELAGDVVSGLHLTPEPARFRQIERSEDVAPLLPSQLPPETPIRLLEETPQCLSFRFPAMPNRLMRIVVPLFILAFMSVWMAGAGFIAWQRWGGGMAFGVVGSVMPLLMLALGMIPVGGALFLGFGRTTVRLTRDEFLCRWSLGPFGRQWGLPVSDIECIYLERDREGARNRQDAESRRVNSRKTSGGIVVAAPNRIVVVAPFAEAGFSRQVAGLIKAQLASWGRTVPVQWVDPARADSP